MKIIRTTVSNQKEARKIADSLVAQGIAKCVSFRKISSVYSWKGKTVREGEVALDIKCGDGKQAKLIVRALEKMHPYEIPMILIIDAKENKKYGKWLRCKE
jgi:periplasmic divalent cation tolerance protein